MRHIDDIIKVVMEHPYISSIHKQVLIARIEKPPTPQEMEEAREEVLDGDRWRR